MSLSGPGNIREWAKSVNSSLMDGSTLLRRYTMRGVEVPWAVEVEHPPADEEEP